MCHVYRYPYARRSFTGRAYSPNDNELCQQIWRGLESGSLGYAQCLGREALFSQHVHPRGHSDMAWLASHVVSLASAMISILVLIVEYSWKGRFRMKALRELEDGETESVEMTPR